MTGSREATVFSADRLATEPARHRRVYNVQKAEKPSGGDGRKALK
jgi:hypothetical protein